MIDIDPRVANAGVSLSLDWGKHWLRPINDRLARCYPELVAADLVTYDALCRKARDDAHAHFFALCERNLRTEREHQAAHGELVKSQYPWISSRVLSRLYQQGWYYARKDGYRLPPSEMWIARLWRTLKGP